MVLIAGAAALGTTSHFNMSTPLHAAVWYTMAASIASVWTMNLLAAVLLLIQRLPDPAFAWALRLGLLVSLVGMAVAFPITQETSEQERAAEAAGIEAPIQGAHAVGVEDGGPGLPVTGWSTTGGDLRVPHFVGLHGLQALPFSDTCWPSLLRPGSAWGTGSRWCGLLASRTWGSWGLLTWRALRGQPLISPDALTLGALFALVLTAGTVASAVVLRARRGKRG